MAEKGGYRHFMLKEIFEQPNTVRDTFRSRISLEEGRVDLEDTLPAELAKGFHKVCIIACGTSYHAGLVSRYWFEEVAGKSVHGEKSEEIRFTGLDDKTPAI